MEKRKEEEQWCNGEQMPLFIKEAGINAFKNSYLQLLDDLEQLCNL